MYEALDANELFRCELLQLAESGRDPERLAALAAATRLPAGVRLDDPAVTAAFEAAAAVPPGDGPRCDEPEGLPAIEAAADFPEPEPYAAGTGFEEVLTAAWSGRIAGNMLGKPVESGEEWTAAAIESHLRRCGAWPLRDWFPDVDPGPDAPAYRPDNRHETTRGNVDGSSRDDDIDYTILNLHVLRRRGPGFTTADVAEAWLSLLPFLQTYTAERVALRNLIGGRGAAGSAAFRNPYREWIGAAIRADVFGYVRPGDPAGAARLAHRDAVLSHTGNGVYGEMWAAALVAAAFTAGSARAAVERALRVVPPGSRLHEAVSGVCADRDRGLSWRACRARIERDLGRYCWIHTVNNAAVLTAGLLYGDGDFTDSIGLTVSGGLDTDSNGGTAGSVAALLAGPAGVPPHWTDPLHDRVRSAVFGYDGASIRTLARWTAEVARG